MNTLDEYLALARAHPEKFNNPPGSIFAILLDPTDIYQAEAAAEKQLLAQGATAAHAHEWSRVGIVYQDQYVCMLRDAVRFPDGALGTYIRMVDVDDDPPGVIILPIHQGKVVLVRHFRHATRSWSLEIPRGFGSPGASSDENVRRELREEIGADPINLIPLGLVQPNAGASAETNEIFFAEVASVSHPETQEAISAILELTVAEFEAMIQDNRIIDAFTLSAYAHAKAHGLL